MAFSSGHSKVRPSTSLEKDNSERPDGRNMSCAASGASARQVRLVSKTKVPDRGTKDALQIRREGAARFALKLKRRPGFLRFQKFLGPLPSPALSKNDVHPGLLKIAEPAGRLPPPHRAVLIGRVENAVRRCDLGDEGRETREITGIYAELAEFLPRKSVTCTARSHTLRQFGAQRHRSYLKIPRSPEGGSEWKDRIGIVTETADSGNSLSAYCVDSACLSFDERSPGG